MMDSGKGAGAGVGVGMGTNQAAMDRWDKARWTVGTVEMVSGQLEDVVDDSLLCQA